MTVLYWCAQKMPGWKCAHAIQMKCAGRAPARRASFVYPWKHAEKNHSHIYLSIIFDIITLISIYAHAALAHNRSIGWATQLRIYLYDDARIRTQRDEKSILVESMAKNDRGKSIRRMSENPFTKRSARNYILLYTTTYVYIVVVRIVGAWRIQLNCCTFNVGAGKREGGQNNMCGRATLKAFAVNRIG